MSILDDLQWRGLVHDSTHLDELREHLGSGPVTFYVGFDPTAESLHVGSLVQLLTARRLQLAGHRPLILVGGATGQIGDPKDTAERALNPPEVIAEWVDKIREQVRPFVSFDGDNAATLVSNLDWTGPMSVIDFLRDVGKHFPVNRMLAREVVKARLESGISFTEFSYQLLQSHDFFELHRQQGCTLQFGGSDQWGNISAGVDYIRRRGAGPVHAFTTPLVTKADGTKFGKSETGTVWLSPKLTSPYAFYQFWFNTDDRDVVSYLKYYSFAPREQIDELAETTASRPFARAGQRALAEELTTLVHGAHQCRQAIAASQALFGRGGLAELDPDTLHAALAEAGLVTITEQAPTVASLLRDTGLVSSLNEARRAIAEAGAYLNNERVTDVHAVVGADDLMHGRWVVLRRGKRAVAGAELVR